MKMYMHLHMNKKQDFKNQSEYMWTKQNQKELWKTFKKLHQRWSIKIK